MFSQEGKNPEKREPRTTTPSTKYGTPLTLTRRRQFTRRHLLYRCCRPTPTEHAYISVTARLAAALLIDANTLREVSPHTRQIVKAYF